MDFGNLFTDWESELCDNNAERDRSYTQLAARLYWAILAPPKYHAHFLTPPVQRLQLYRSAVKPTRDQNAAGCRESGVNTDSRISDYH